MNTVLSSMGRTALLLMQRSWVNMRECGKGGAEGLFLTFFILFDLQMMPPTPHRPNPEENHNGDPLIWSIGVGLQRLRAGWSRQERGSGRAAGSHPEHTQLRAKHN